jgi:cytochrome c553
MIRKIFKVVLIAIALIVLLAAGFYTKVYLSTESRMNRYYAVTPQTFSIHPDSALLAKGKRLSVVKGCVECHGEDLSGKIMNDDFMLGMLSTSNLTKGKGGLPTDYGITDWVLALKHGIRKDGKPLIFMPSHEFTHLSEEDMKAVIAYCSQIPPVDHELPEINIGPVARILTDLDKFPLVPAEMIDHNTVLVKSVKEEVSIEYGKYLSTSCQGCHKESMKGGEAVAPGYPIVADITSTGNPGKWTSDQFITTLRTGVTPEGKKLKPEEMPWPMAKALTDTELKALHLYLTSL